MGRRGGGGGTAGGGKGGKQVHYTRVVPRFLRGLVDEEHDPLSDKRPEPREETEVARAAPDGVDAGELAELRAAGFRVSGQEEEEGAPEKPAEKPQGGGVNVGGVAKSRVEKKRREKNVAAVAVRPQKAFGVKNKSKLSFGDDDESSGSE